MSSDEQGRILIGLARDAIAGRLGLPHAQQQEVTAPWLLSNGATFVTLTQEGSLRGCIGSLVAHRPLWEDVRDNAVAAAFRDPRFPPLAADEFDRTRVEVSLLSEQEPMRFTSEADAMAQLQSGVDGVVLEYGRHRGTFLPQVWEQLPSPAEFMAHLKLKAGLPAQFWADDIRLARYTVEKWKESY